MAVEAVRPAPRARWAAAARRGPIRWAAGAAARPAVKAAAGPAGAAETQRAARGPRVPVTGKSFLSQIPMECGRGPDGGVSCRWRVTFQTNGTFTWQHSDIAETGTYTCTGVTITGTRSGGGTINGQYIPISDSLIWDNVTYTPQ